ncbi:MAG TPA: hypothetical protein VNW04_03215 [Puia sp.]|jgi:hypothetical protein|nr:hypothetical protein [Puia sp.]
MRTSFLLLLLLPAFCARSQTTAAAATGPNPQYLNTVYYWAADTLQALEKTNGELKNKIRFYGAGGASYVIDGPRSTVRIRSGTGTRFAIKLSGMMDPSQLIKLYRFDSQKKNREAAASQGNKNVIDCNVQKSGADVYVLIPATALSPGEYGFQNVMMMNGAGSTRMSYTFFAFGVDQ